MASPREIFGFAGPVHLTAIDWKNTYHQRSVAASLVQAVYVLERDRQANRQGPNALAPPWWEFFHFHLIRTLVDEVDSSIFGAIYEYKPYSSDCVHLTHGNGSMQLIQGAAPRHVIAFRGTITKGDAFSQDLKLDIELIKNGLHLSPRYEVAVQAVRNVVASSGDMNIWLTGHSLGSAMALLAGKEMAKTGIYLEAFLFNPPFFSAPIERIKDKRIKHGIRIAGSLITAGLTIAMKKYHHKPRSEDPFFALSPWMPCLFVNPSDHICSEYIGYFEHRTKMEEIGAAGIERLATQNSVAGLFFNAAGRESEPLHLLPSANLTVNSSPSNDFKQAHGIHQWWNPHFQMESTLYHYR